MTTYSLNSLGNIQKKRKSDINLIKRCVTIRAKKLADPEDNGRFGDKLFDLSEYPKYQVFEIAKHWPKDLTFQIGETSERMGIATCLEDAFNIQENTKTPMLVIPSECLDMISIPKETIYIELWRDNLEDPYRDFMDLEFFLVGVDGYITTMVKPPIEDASWSDVFNHPELGPAALLRAKENALDFSYYWNSMVFE